MKKKIFSTAMVSLFFLATLFSFNISQSNQKGEIKVITVNDENGKVTKTEETYQLKELDKVQKMLSEIKHPVQERESDYSITLDQNILNSVLVELS